MLASATQPGARTYLAPGEAAEAARYALLRRLAPSMRHHLVVNLQPIGMIYEVLDRRLRSPQPNLATVHESAQKINGFARAALNSCMDVVSWLAPDEAALYTLQEGTRECASLLASSLSFRGYTLRIDVGAVEGQLRRAAMRTLLTAALIHATDELPAPAELLLSAAGEEAGARLLLAIRQTDGDKGFANEPAYRPLQWADVQALAEAEGAEATRERGERIELLIPWATTAA
jgi:hypothetical protein